METTGDRPATRAARYLLRPVLSAVAVLLVLVWGLSALESRLPSWVTGPRAPTITNDVVVQQVRSVAKLVSTEMTLRDVVQFEQTRYASTKRGLYVITGRVLAGIDLEGGTKVSIDHAAKRITITLPPARVLAVDVLTVRTYDERSGLLNPFTIGDRDAIRGQIRAQLVTAASSSGLLAKADTSAREVLRSLLSRDGYTVDVGLPGAGITLDRAPTQ
jgi:hypothetical protein